MLLYGQYIMKPQCHIPYMMPHGDIWLPTAIKQSLVYYPDSKVHGAYMGPTWGRQDPGGPHVGHVNLVIWVTYLTPNYYGSDITNKNLLEQKH